jgi:hypothetical protein
MESRVNVKLCRRLSPDGRLVPALLYFSDDAKPSAGVVVIPEGWGEPLGTEDIKAIYATTETPVVLADAAVESGYRVWGQPRG